MDTALRWANELSPDVRLPEDLTPASKRVELVEDFERKVMAEYVLGDLVRRDPSKGQLHNLNNEEKARVLKTVGQLSTRYLPSVSENDRISIALKLWAGCVSAGKTIAMQTRSGPNTETNRRETFSAGIDTIAKDDPVYRAGVEAAPSWKSGRKEPVSYDGVPSNSAVRKFS